MVLVYSYNLSAGQDICQKRKARYIHKNIVKSFTVELCEMKKGQNKYIVSRSCLNDMCSPLKEPRKAVVIESKYQALGSPYFKLCHQLGGIPQLFEFIGSDNEWVQANRCLFDNKDQDFVETSHLFTLWGENVTFE